MQIMDQQINYGHVFHRRKLRGIMSSHRVSVCLSAHPLTALPVACELDLHFAYIPKPGFQLKGLCIISTLENIIQAC